MMKLFTFRLAGTLLGVLTIAGNAAHADYLGYSGFEETYSITSSGTYDITAAGAQGGGSSNDSGGLGAIIDANVYLTAGTQLDVVVGGEGANGAYGDLYGGGGGGGTFVWIDASTSPLIVAGGGGGAAWANSNGGSGLSGTFGSGLGGAGTGSEGAGGGGWFSDGGGASCASGGASSADGFGGGGSCYTPGGFGGGGGGGFDGGGGGGGFDGGAGSSGGAGGGDSYLDPSVTLNSATDGANSGNGFVDITQVGPSAPEPGSIVLLTLGLGGLAFSMRKKLSA